MSYDKEFVKRFVQGFGKTMTLFMIGKKRMHGYAIIKKLEEIYCSEKMPNKIRHPGPSIVYPILHDLEKRGLIKGHWESKGKRKIKYYEITPKGKATIAKIKKMIDEISKIWDKFWREIR